MFISVSLIGKINALLVSKSAHSLATHYDIFEKNCIVISSFCEILSYAFNQIFDLYCDSTKTFN